MTTSAVSEWHLGTSDPLNRDTPTWTDGHLRLYHNRDGMLPNRTAINYAEIYTNYSEVSTV